MGAPAGGFGRRQRIETILISGMPPVAASIIV